MTASAIKHRVVAITIALALTLTINTAISYAARSNADIAAKNESHLRSGGTIPIPTDSPRP